MPEPSQYMKNAWRLQAESDAKRAAAAALQPVTEAPGYEFRPELIPDVSSHSEKTEEDLELDQILDSIGVMDAYVRWCGKMTPVAYAGQTEGVKISCPIPGHADKDPSAWINTEKNVWHCGGCQSGGDPYDIAAYHHGFPVPGYKEGALFHKLRRAMGEDLGYSFKEKIGGGYDLVPPVVILTQPAPPQVSTPLQAPPTQGILQSVPAAEDGTTPNLLHLVPQVPQEVPVPAANLVSQVPTEDGEPLASVISIDPEQDAYDPELDSEQNIPTFPWREALVGQEDTFLYQWCEATSYDYSPEEYHLFSGLLLLGLAAGRDVIMADGTRPVMANLSVCFLGKTGSGKSSAQNYISKAIMDVMPDNDLGIMQEGAKYIGEVASGEALIGEFQKIVQGSATGHVPIKGYVEFSELSSLLAKGSIQGSTLKTKIMDFIDGKPFISNSSQTHGRKVAMNAFAAFSTSSQPRALRKLLDGQDSASGYLNRWIYVAGPMKERPSFFGGPQIDLRPAFNKLAAISIGARRKNPTHPPVQISVSPEAADAFNTFFAPVNTMIQYADNDMIARLEIHYKKLLLCHALNRHAVSIGIQDVQFIEKLHPYILKNFKLVGAEIGKNQNQEFVDRILNYIKRKEVEGNGIGPNRSMVRNAMKTKNLTDKQINDAIDTLVRASIIEEFKVKKTGPGRPAVRLGSVKHA